MKKKLFKRVLIIGFLLITFFSIKINSSAASFAYKDFNWEEFSKQNKSFWVSFCDTSDDENCEDRVLLTKKRFYIRLYSLLTTMQNKGYFIDDNYIIATVFYGLHMETFADPTGDKYDPYNLDDADSSSTKDKYIGDIAEDELDAAQSYFNSEEDSLKSLINSFVGYNMGCFGVSNETPVSQTDSNGNTITTCSSGLEVYKGMCVEKINSYKGNFFDSIGLTFLGSDNKEKCEKDALDKGYSTVFTDTSTTKEVNEDFYWSYLENSPYFDNKDHLQDYYASVLGKVKKSHMKELEPDEREKYKNEIIDVRKRLIRGIEDILDNYKNISEQYNSVTQQQYWWPIGSEETTESDGVFFASGDPTKTYISSQYGIRIHPISGDRKKHDGIDIPGDLNITNVIASKDGVVVSSSKSSGIDCPDGSDDSCGGGYGNYVIIQHVDGNYTLYAHMASNSVVVLEGDSVKAGQVIGKVGDSGSSTGAHLHFEVRVGMNDKSASQDPLLYVSPTNPRPSSVSQEFSDWIAAMEGTGPMAGGHYKVYNDSGGVATVGHGVTIKYNKELFRANGINPDTLYVGSTLPVAVVDKIYLDIVAQHVNDVKSMLSSKGISLNDTQINALSSLKFNCGNINGFFDNYAKYGSSQSLCTNWWHNKALYDQRGNKLPGLVTRRQRECTLFTTGVYQSMY